MHRIKVLLRKIPVMKKGKLFYAVAYLMLVVYTVPMQGCSKYTVTTNQKDPADVYYKKKIVTSYFWGVVNNPHKTVDTTCGSAGLDEVKITSNLGYSLIHVATLGIVNLVKVEWKCHKPAPVVGYQP